MKNCPYCGALGNFYFKISSITYKRCLGCDLIYKEKQDSYDKIVAYYTNDYFSIYSPDQMGVKKDRLFDSILNLIEKRRGTGRLLDIGAGCGVFLAAAQKKGWTVKGIEPSIESVEVAQRQYSLDIYNGTLQEYNENKGFDVITFINVLDHSVEPWNEIRRARLLLKPEGILFLRFPNGLFHSFIFTVSKKFNIEYTIARFLVFHEYCFTPRFVRRLLSDHGFTDIVVSNASLSGSSLIESFPVFSFVTRLIEIAGNLTDLIFGARFIWSPSLQVIAEKSKRFY